MRKNVTVYKFGRSVQVKQQQQQKKKKDIRIAK